MSDADVEHAGWAAGQPGSRLRRRRNPLVGLLALGMLVVGVAATVIGIVLLANEAGPVEDRVVAHGTVAALAGPSSPAVSFDTAGAGPLTIWLEAGGTTDVRDTIVAGTACEIVRPDGTSAETRGSRQRASVELDHYATIGRLDSAQGTNTITCRHVPFGSSRTRGRLRDEHAFVVERGTPGDGLRGLWLVLPGVFVAILGLPVARRWYVGCCDPSSR